MATTTPGLLPYPAPTDPVAGGAAAIEALAEATDPQLVHYFASPAARDAWTSVPLGALCVTTDTHTLWQRGPAGWVKRPRANCGKVTVTTDASGNGLINLGYAATCVVVSIDRASFGYFAGSGIASFVAAELSPNNQQVNLTFYQMTATGAITPQTATSFVVHYVAPS